MTRAIVAALPAIGSGAPESGPLVFSDPVLAAALESGAAAWADAGVQPPPVGGVLGALGRDTVVAVSDTEFSVRCDTTAKKTLACTAFEPTQMWIRESLFSRPGELTAIVTHEMGHVMQGKGAPNQGQLTAADGCVDGAPSTARGHIICAWARSQITAVDVTLVDHTAE